ncbi:YD repeat-containing protein [Chitinophaga skermanii]|uniref:YD repeat-containing protein n=1 Tax=Chitinophaga skermanii TaxID=331697 RepID=A0A327QKP3_9BACT|nr:hypothetical protein [Chitinophaga skermanii]RAJ02327.1 YD repeat-containing protein [Chitinophaga skermanii]
MVNGSLVARDAFGFALHYFGERDYSPIRTGVKPFASAEAINANFRPLFNENIDAISQNNDRAGEPLLFAYSYDVLNRITGMKAHRGLNTSINTWTSLPALNDFKETIQYDPNGNILKYIRNGNTLIGNRPLAMDNLTYHYKAGTNNLDHIRDVVDPSNYANDIDDQIAGNYAYDEIGNLIKDNKDSVSAITWNVYGKISSINSKNGIITYTYDAAGNRISKKINNIATWYICDATGNVMSTYVKGNTLLNNGQLS